MEKLLDFTRLGVPDEGGELAEIGSLDLSDGPEMLQEQADGLFADAGNLLQLTMDKRLAPKHLNTIIKNCSIKIC